MLPYADETSQAQTGEAARGRGSWGWPDALRCRTYWADTQPVSFPSGRFIAFLAVDSSATLGDVIGLALHEGFHSFQRMSRRE
jgi:hypothetical protein